MKRLLILPFLFGCGINLFSQGIQLSPINSRIEVAKEVPDIISLGVTDTLELPFFDDFVGNRNGQPNSKLWIDRDVWVSNGFIKKPVNAYYAVFDHLTEKGKPYGTLNQSSSVFADSLTTQPIDLTSYTPSNNVLLSFFWGTGGLGDPSEVEDSLVLYFKDNAGAWVQQWSAGGNNFSQEMAPVSILLKNSSFFHKTFQFRFVNYTKETGNLNHFFIDYVSLADNRLKDTSYNGFIDIGITGSSGSLLTEYSQMPYEHFKLSPGSNIKGTHCVNIRSLHKSQTVQTRFGINYYNQYGTLVASIPSTTNALNIIPDTFAEFCFPTLALDTLSGNNPTMQMQYVISPQGGTEYPVDNNALEDNNLYSYTQRFNPWYAYDDGSAEGGIGLDYTSLPTNHKGQFALKFNNKKADSLKGIAIYFNRSKEDVTFRSFKLKVWDELSPVGQPDNSDKLLYSIDVSKPAYTDSINGFAYIMFDSAIALPVGDFYVGWEQAQKFLLNVGYDNNYRFENQERFNPNVFHNLLNSWEKGFNVFGTPMMRPILGKDEDFYFGTNGLELQKISLFPNPVNNQLTISHLPANATVKVMSMDGRVVTKGDSSVLNLGGLKTGIYFVQVEHGTQMKLLRFVKN